MMSSDHYMECHTLPAINETFSQFNARPSATISAAANLIYSPLDLSLRAGPNIAPITPPTTPSPPRKRHRLMSEENYLWRPHMSSRSSPSISTTTSTTPALVEYTNHYLHSVCYAKREGFYPSMSEEEVCNHSNVPNYVAAEKNFCEIPKSQRSVIMLSAKNNEQEEHHNHQQKQSDVSGIYVDDETILLTEDDDDDDDEDDEGKEEEEDDDEAENETVVSSQEFADTRDITEESSEFTAFATIPTTTTTTPTNKTLKTARQELVDYEVKSIANVDEEEEYVDILSNDDDELNPLASGANTILRLQSQSELEQELEKSGKVLTRNKLIYDNEEMHNKAVNGLEKLFNRDFQKLTDNNDVNEQNIAKDTEKTYIDLTNCQQSKETHQQLQQPIELEREKNYYCLPSMIGMESSGRPLYKTHKTERKRMKLRKQMSLDEETLSPVSGTIIRKLRDDEELVVRKGDIDPAFNVVEVTEEAKAILASIDNKIGAYLCQLCRTLYDDAFKLAQHRCPRIVHIEYKCSECDKVFNCPANLASHRRWHKPKSEILASSQSKKRLNQNHFPGHISDTSQHKSNTDDVVDGIFPCTQCGKTFRRNAYLKKHQASHQMLDNLKHLDMFKSPRRENPSTFHQPQGFGCSTVNTNQRSNSSALYSPFGPLHAPRPYPNRFGTLPFNPTFDYRRFYSLGELYLTQQLDRSSAFQYVHANHLRNLNNMANASNFINRPMASSPLMPLPVK
uniref:C2H2-type domain-containing protein n=1 Tax=Glossina brevipalpis TaxID=37001 RepID=A0A1A9X413_9MUSC